MSALPCSSCEKELLGSAVLVSREDEGELPHGITYSATQSDFWLLHPRCFTSLIDEILRGEGMAALYVAVGPIGEIREALVM